MFCHLNYYFMLSKYLFLVFVFAKVHKHNHGILKQVKMLMKRLEGIIITLTLDIYFKYEMTDK